MSVSIDHLLVPVRDKGAAAQWLADLVGLEVRDRSAGAPPGRFAVVRVGQTSIGFHDSQRPAPFHLAFLVSDAHFNAVLARVKSGGVSFWADPAMSDEGQLNGFEGGRGFYVRDPDNHAWEFLTRTLD